MIAGGFHSGEQAARLAALDGTQPGVPNLNAIIMVRIAGKALSPDHNMENDLHEPVD